jgi:hypothetical protein
MRVCSTVRLFCLPLVAGAFISCSNEQDAGHQAQSVSPPTAGFPATYARQWMTNLENSIRGDVISPPVASRTYAYAAIAMYEAVVHGMPGYHSLAGQLNGLDSLPTPDPALDYDWPTVLAQTMHQMVAASVPPFVGAEQRGPYTFPNRIFFEYTTTTQAPLISLGPIQIGFRRAAGVSSEVIDNSIAFADELAAALVAWSETDGYYEGRYKGYVPPTGPDKWAPTGFSDNDKVANPLEPYFGSVRPLAMSSGSECSPASLGIVVPPFSTDPESEFYQQARAVYDASLDLTEQQRIIARFWEDGPGATSTPPGHWVAITSQLVKNDNLGRAVEVYATVSMGFLDSFIAIWQSKYDYNLLRPTTYIRRHIDSDWLTLLGTPQFPTYASGHSGQSGASARLLTSVFGDISFTDTTKVRRGFNPRTFSSFYEAANEVAASRFYGGIHYPMDNLDGLTMGYCVADKILERVQLHD